MDLARIFTTENLTVLALLILSVGIHELSHGLVAHWRGDPTPKEAGRLTLNPIRHLDFFASFLQPVILMVLTGGRFWFAGAKPMPVQPAYMKNPRFDLSLVAAAGPSSNWIMALGTCILFYAAIAFGWAKVDTFFGNVCEKFVQLNLFFVLLNLLPIPPLDGYKVIRAFLPQGLAVKLDRIEMFGLLIVIGLLVWQTSAIWFQRGIDFLEPSVTWPLHIFKWVMTGGRD